MAFFRHISVKNGGFSTLLSPKWRFSPVEQSLPLAHPRNPYPGPFFSTPTLSSHQFPPPNLHYSIPTGAVALAISAVVPALERLTSRCPKRRRPKSAVVVVAVVQRAERRRSRSASRRLPAPPWRLDRDVVSPSDCSRSRKLGLGGNFWATLSYQKFFRGKCWLPL